MKQFETLFDAVAHDYGNVLFFQVIGRDFADWASASIEGDAHVLELGAGRGATSIPLSRQVMRGSGVYLATDISHQMCRHLAQDEQRILVGQANACQLPFTSNTFDAVVSAYSVNFFVPLAQALDEVRRVLRPAGRFFIVTPCPSTRSALPAFDRVLGTYVQRVDREQWPFGMVRDPELEFRSFGFEATRSNVVEKQSAFPSFEHFWKEQMSHGLRGFYLALSREDRHSFELEARTAVGAGEVIDTNAARFVEFVKV